MRLIRLSPEEADYLRSVDYLVLELRQTLSDQVDSSSMSISLDDAIAEQCRESFTDRLALVGFDQDYELSDEGELLEDLIDRFSG